MHTDVPKNINYGVNPYELGDNSYGRANTDNPLMYLKNNSSFAKDLSYLEEIP
jgi:hypothetical protein